MNLTIWEYSDIYRKGSLSGEVSMDKKFEQIEECTALKKQSSQNKLLLSSFVMKARSHCGWNILMGSMGIECKEDHRYGD